jgi:truncated hemoglobin YjbI
LFADFLLHGGSPEFAKKALSSGLKTDELKRIVNETIKIKGMVSDPSFRQSAAKIYRLPHEDSLAVYELGTIAEKKAWLPVMAEKYKHIKDDETRADFLERMKEATKELRNPPTH